MNSLESDIALILLSAGRARRFGADKLQADFCGRPLWEWSAKAAEEAGFTRRYMVLAERSSLSPRPGWRIVVNRTAADGMGTSIAAGVAAARECSRVVIALADMPFVEPSHLRALASACGTVFTRHAQGKAGCPAAFPQATFADLRSLRGDRGARSLALADATILRPPSEATLTDVDDPAELRRLEEQVFNTASEGRTITDMP